SMPMLADETGRLCYAFADDGGAITLAAGANDSRVRGVRASVQARRSNLERFRAAFAASIPQSGLGLFTSNYPREGKVRSLVFLVSYKDVDFTLDDPKDYFSRLFNEKGFADYGATGSVRDYFLDQSEGRFDITYDVYGPVTLANNRSYYGRNIGGAGNDAKPEMMVEEAAELLKNEIDFSQYDYDGDGNIDNIFIVFAGEGEATGGPAASVWPHAYNVEEGKYYNGKQLYGYCCVQEWLGSGGDNRPSPIGTFVHEFSHVMGLPDLYHTSDSYAAYTPGDWSVLDYGPYNNDGHTPPAYGAYERNAMGWIEPVVLDGPSSISLEHILTSNSCCLIPTEKQTEFFLLENRQQRGWDKYVPGHGMLIWHIDFNQSIFDSNIVNNSKSHQYVDIVEANGLTNNMSTSVMAGYAFPGTANVTSFTSETRPALVSWAGKSIGLPITDITETDGVISFLVDGGLTSLDRPSAPVMTAADDGSVTVAWSPVENAAGYIVNVYSEGHIPGSFTTQETSYTVTGCRPETEYYATVRAYRGSTQSELSDEASVRTPVIAFRYLAPVAISAVIDSEAHATLEWEPLEGAASYLLTVEAGSESAGSTETLTFGVPRSSSLVIPDGWNWTGTTGSTYTSTSYCVEAPSLKMSSNGVMLQSPVYGVDVKNISLWVCGANAVQSNSLQIAVRPDASSQYTTIAEVSPSLYNGSGTVIDIPSVPEGSRQIALTYVKQGSGNVAVDDLSITLGGSTFATIDGYDRNDVGDITSHTLDVPASAGQIRFFVEAVNAGGETSARSNVVTASFMNGVGFVDSVDADTPVEYYNLQGIRVARPSSGLYIRRQGSRTAKVYIR
ncbi:MAG: M6 family metalloprotease domain-containing protein, partial [Muribaculaceae bacterium]|nr:M6 family metalloprotease domain-containing protein [Muribaculaceae bacterium]